MNKLELSIFIGIMVSLIISSVTAFAGDSEALRGEVLRLHILANSDSDEDQELKLSVRDFVLENFGGYLSPMQNKDEARLEAVSLLPDIELRVGEFVKQKGYDYGINAEIVKMDFNTRTYEDITLPAGRYDALRITIGNALGKNWWCVIYPPVCVPAAAKTEDTEKLHNDPVASKNPKFEPRFKIVEILQNFWPE